MITFLLPAVLGASAVAAAPFIIHFLLKPRPRKQLFAGIRLLRASSFQGMRRQRLSQWLLILTRMLLLLAVVLGAARPLWNTPGAPGAGAPVAVVFCFDTSASMHYQTARGTRIAAAVAWAESLLSDEQRFPAGSQFLVLDNGRDAGTRTQTPAWTRDRDLAFRALHVDATPVHDHGVNSLLGEARIAVAQTSEAIREVYLFTDLAAHAWSGGSTSSQPVSLDATAVTRAPNGVIPATQPSAGPITINILNVGQPENRNTAIQFIRPDDAHDPAAAIRRPPGRPTTLQAAVVAGDEPIEPQVELWLDGAMVARTEPLTIAAANTRTAEITTPPLSTGIHLGELRLDRPDRLIDDNAAYFALDVGDRVKVALLAADDPAAGVEVRRIAALLAPESLPDERRPFDVQTQPIAALDMPDIESARLIIWVEPSTISSQQSARLQALAQGGASVLLIAGPNMKIENNSTPGATPQAVVQCREPLEFAAEATNIASLRGHAVYQYLKLVPDKNAVITQTFANADPAIVKQPAGRGRIIWWAFSLRPDWSDLGIRAAPILVRLHQLARQADANAQRTANLLCDQSTPLDLPPDASNMRLTRLAPSPIQSNDLKKSADTKTLTPRTDSAGLYRVTSTSNSDHPQVTVAGWAVNLHAAESDPRRMSDDAIRTALPAQEVAVHHDAKSLTALTRTAQTTTPLDGTTLTAALALLMLESWLSRRAYRPVPAPA